MDVLRRDLRASEPSVRVRAATELLAEERRRRAEQQVVAENDRAWRAFSSAITDEERTALIALTHQVKLLRYRVYQRCPEARPDNYAEPIVIARSDMAPGTLYLHEENGAICEAGAWDAPPATTAVVAEDIDVHTTEDDDEYIEVHHDEDQ
jgi:hypothetical protein